jgi:hypothetical protein
MKLCTKGAESAEFYDFGRIEGVRDGECKFERKVIICIVIDLLEGNGIREKLLKR